jgi:hypothetical protein
MYGCGLTADIYMDGVVMKVRQMVMVHGVVEVEFYKRGFTLLRTDDEKVRCIHRVF